MFPTTPALGSLRPSIHPSIHPRSWFLLIPKPEPEIDGLKMECVAAAAIVTCVHAMLP